MGLFDKRGAVKANAKWFERYGDLRGACTARRRKNQGEKMFAKVRRYGIATPLAG
jgi:hypothetical protein